MNFKEYCVTLEDESLTNCELMLHINEKGKVIRVYCYSDNLPTFYDYNSFEEKKINFLYKPCDNKLFVDLKISTMIKYFNHMYFGEEDVENFDKNQDIYLNSVVNKYKYLIIN